MENVWKASKTIILFLIIMVVCQVALGEKGAQKMALFILFSMLILQADSVASFTNKITSNLTNFTTEQGGAGSHTSSSGQTHGGGSSRR